MGLKISIIRNFEYNDEDKCYICSYNIKKSELLICFDCNKSLHFECNEIFHSSNIICHNCDNYYGSII